MKISSFEIDNEESKVWIEAGEIIGSAIRSEIESHGMNYTTFTKRKLERERV